MDIALISGVYKCDDKRIQMMFGKKNVQKSFSSLNMNQNAASIKNITNKGC